MKNQSRIHVNGSRRAAVSQSQKHHSSDRPKGRAGESGDNTLPMLAIFPKGERDGVSSDIIDLSKAEYAQIERAAVGCGISPGLYIANAALEKIGSPRMQRLSESPAMSAHQELENAVYKSVALINILAREASEGMSGARESVWNTVSAGFINLGCDVSSELKRAFDLAWGEYHDAKRATGANDQRRAA